MKEIISELSILADFIDNADLERLVDSVKETNHIFLAGAGRSGLAIRFFANRLMHLGKSVSVVGDITSPHSKLGDLLIIGSGSGETDSLVSLARKAKKSKVQIALVTMDPSSTIASVADVVITMPGVSPKLKNKTEYTSIQPLGSAFEQLCLIMYDAVGMRLMDELGENSDSMFERHADLE